ncbi:MAG: N-6 DNA methylase [Streptococcaceae bacterium]|nr:N-6 DNA methylase [Streptococcaceae bacterium]MCL2681265.1 N-6 DNA methylase [Streptococcaceae bacterium]
MAEIKYLNDYLTGKKIIATPEEPNRQEMLRILHEDYGYPKELMLTEFGVKKSPSDTRRSALVDIAVFESEKDFKNKKAKIFVETKKPNYNEGKEQLYDYLSFEKHTTFGIWYNGYQENGQSIGFYRKKFENEEPKFEEVVDIPKFGFADISEQIKRNELQPTNNLKNIFKNLRGYIAANATGTTRDSEILEQLIMIVIAKLYDEKYKEGEFSEFRVIENNEKKTRDRIEGLLTEARTRWDDIFDETDTIKFDDRTLKMVVGQLQNYSLEKSSRNVISEAFESIISYATKGSQGQFFTPKNIVDLMVEIAKPEKNQTVLDPASGTSGFLISSMFYVWDKIQKNGISPKAQYDLMQTYAGNNLFGIEKDSFLSRIAKAYMAVLGDGRAGLFIEDSLNEESWGSNTKAKIEGKKFDFILTNPPFGKDVKLDLKTKKIYDFGDSVELAFIEQSIKHLKDGGLLGVILPETVFHAPGKSVAREKLFFKHNITHIIDLPHDTFRPFNNAKCDIVFIQKNKPQQKDVIAIKIAEIGHDHLGKEKYRLDKKTLKFTTEVADDIPNIIHQLQTDKWNDAEIRKVSSVDIKNNDLLVARPYFTIDDIPKGYVTLGELINQKVIEAFDGHGSPESHLKGLGDYPYIRVKDIVNLEIAHNRLDDIPESEFLRLRGKEDRKKLKINDIVFVRRGSYRIGDVGIVFEKDLNSILTREILTLRVLDNKLGLTPFNLLGILNSEIVRNQLKNLVLLDTTLPNIGDRWKKISINISDIKVLRKQSDKIEAMVESRKLYWKNYSSIFGVNG